MPGSPEEQVRGIIDNRHREAYALDKMWDAAIQKFDRENPITPELIWELQREGDPRVLMLIWYIDALKMEAKLSNARGQMAGLRQAIGLLQWKQVKGVQGGAWAMLKHGRALVEYAYKQQEKYVMEILGRFHLYHYPEERQARRDTMEPTPEEFQP